MNGRSSKIRTCDPHVPNVVLYQTELYSDARERAYRAGGQGPQASAGTSFLLLFGAVATLPALRYPTAS